MAKKIRFPLKLAEGAEVRTLEELREHFDLEALLGYYKNKKLLTWLEDRYLEGEAEAVRALDEAAPDFQKRLCEVFQVEYTGSDVDLEEIGRRQERLKRLRLVTDEQEYIDHIDQVAFDQEDLADLLDEEQTTIYLCGEKFTVPASRKGVVYVGIHKPAVHISGTLPEDPEELGIEFRGCAVDNLPVAKPVISDVTKAVVTGIHLDAEREGYRGILKGVFGSIKQADMKVYGDSWSELAGRIGRFLKGIGLECYGSSFAEFLVEEFGPKSKDVQVESLADLYKLTDDVLDAHELDRKDIRTFRDKLIYATAKAPDYVVFGSMGWPDIGVARAKMIFKVFNGDSNLVNCSPWKALGPVADDLGSYYWHNGKIIREISLNDVRSAIGDAIYEKLRRAIIGAGPKACELIRDELATMEKYATNITKDFDSVLKVGHTDISLSADVRIACEANNFALVDETPFDILITDSLDSNSEKMQQAIKNSCLVYTKKTFVELFSA